MDKSHLVIFKKFVERINEFNEIEYHSKSIDFEKAQLIQEIIAVSQKYINDIEDNIEYHNHSMELNLKILKTKLELHLMENGEIDISNGESYSLFWTSFISWFYTDENIENNLLEKYLVYNTWGDIEIVSIDLPNLYRIHNGINKTEEQILNDYSIEGIRNFIEMAFVELIVPNRRYNYTIKVNKLLSKFRVPYKLQNGRIITNGLQISHEISKIVDYKMFERKIRYAEEMISSDELLDKKTALDYLVDSLQYFISIQDGNSVKNKYKSTSELIGNNDNKYNVIKNELEEIMKISNAYFDIRHNEYLNTVQERREALNNKLLA